jgi:hypothetical protein
LCVVMLAVCARWLVATQCSLKLVSSAGCGTKPHSRPRGRQQPVRTSATPPNNPPVLEADVNRRGGRHVVAEAVGRERACGRDEVWLATPVVVVVSGGCCATPQTQTPLRLARRRA